MGAARPDPARPPPPLANGRPARRFLPSRLPGGLRGTARGGGAIRLGRLAHARRRTRPPAEHVVYGDYGADHPGSHDRPVEADGGSPWGIVRYTAERTFLLARVPTRGPDHADAVRAQAGEIVHAEGFRGDGFSDGERWLLSCATGRGTEGVGGPGVWLRAGHIQHMAQVVRALRRRP
ncbi:hypothetical protein [Streptomyces sp. NPDC056431]|uniref:beta family protein n=1 Tax=Streptomyces sp. NPDC056431 TaxID=3345814 RepID=UPI00367D62D5